MKIALPGPTSCLSWRAASRNGAADFHDHDVGFLAELIDDALDLVGDVRDDLHGLAQVITAALAVDHPLVDLPGGVVVAPRSLKAGEALVVSQIEIGFGAVVGDEDLAMLERAHRAGIDVEIGVELLQGHAVAPALEQAADRGAGQALAQRRDHAAGHDDVFGHRVLLADPIARARSRTPAGSRGSIIGCAGSKGCGPRGARAAGARVAGRPRC
jgi:hypothetical protein